MNALEGPVGTAGSWMEMPDGDMMWAVKDASRPDGMWRLKGPRILQDRSGPWEWFPTPGVPGIQSPGAAPGVPQEAMPGTPGAREALRWVMKEADLEMALVMAAQREKRCEEQEVQMRFREMAVFARERAANAIWMQAASRIQWCPGCVKTQLATGGLTPEEFQELKSRDQC